MKEIKLTAEDKAKQLFIKGYNCCQSVFCAFCDKTGIDFQTGLRLASSFGAGMGRMREVCGAVSGMFMVAGILYGYDSPEDMETKTKHYSLIQQLAEKFKEENKTIICRELLGLDKRNYDPSPQERTSQYYKKRPCVELVGCAAKIIDEYMNSMEVKNDNSCSK